MIMKFYKVVFLSLLLHFSNTTTVTAQKDVQPNPSTVKRLQVEAFMTSIDALEVLLDGLKTGTLLEEYELLRFHIDSADSVLNILEKCCKSKIKQGTSFGYTPYTITKTTIENLKILSIDKIVDLLYPEEEIKIHFLNEEGGSITILSKEDLLFWASLKKSICKVRLNILTSVCFSHNWKFSKGSLKMETCAERVLQENLTKIGLDYMPIRVFITNKSGFDVRLNPIVDKFTIVDEFGRQFPNINPNMEEIELISKISDGSKIFGGGMIDVIDIYDGANESVILLFSESTLSPNKPMPIAERISASKLWYPIVEFWSHIVFDSKIEKTLQKGILRKETQ